MYLSEIKIINYKSFRNSEEIKLEPHINIIIGANNSGKTAFLEALSLNFSHKPHRSLITLPERDSPLAAESEVSIKLTVEPHDFEKLIISNKELYFPFPEDSRTSLEVGKAFERCLSENWVIHANLIRAGEIVPDAIDYGLYRESTIHPKNMFRVSWNEEDGIKFIENVGGVGKERGLAIQALNLFKSNIYRFHAERLNVSKSATGSSEELAQDASNLPEVIQVLQNRNHARYTRFIRLVTDVFPEVKWISAETIGNSEIEIKVWTVDPDKERDDLAISLSECGTGIGQVLAILYIVVSSNVSRMIIIDEPQSFLHPRAAKKLINILTKNPQHQYIISTHSSEILAVANPSTITSMEYSEANESVAKSLNKDETHELSNILEKIGVALSDVLYADNILWVEGPTEEKAFPKILEKADQMSALNRVTILPLANTSGVQSKKHADLVQDIYRKLSAVHALVPPVLGIILDREELTEGEMQKRKEVSENLLTFIPRRCFENYLLDSDAIAAVANNQEGFRDSPLTSAEVETWLKGKGKDKGETEWLENVDGARLLSHLFNALSDSRVSFQKTDHSIQLTEWLLENKPAHFESLTTFIITFLESKSRH